MTFEEIKQGEETYIMHTYGRFPIALDHGKGATLWDTDGKKYIDLTSGIGVNSLGHDNEALTTAVSEQAHKLMHLCTPAPCITPSRWCRQQRSWSMQPEWEKSFLQTPVRKPTRA